jgi:hypothetical protein
MTLKPSYVFDDHNEAQAFARQHKPPAGMKWGFYPVQIGEDEYSSAMELRAEERWPIGEPPAREVIDMTYFVPDDDEE